MRTHYFRVICTMIGLIITLQSCDLFEYHPYSVEIDGPHHINSVNAAHIESLGLTTPFKFAFISDTQGSYDETQDAVDDMLSRGDIDFIIHGGDMTDFGLPKEFKLCRNIFSGSGIPYVAAIGNHDCLGNGEDTFNYLFGPENFSFNVGPLHIVILNTVALEYDYSHPVPDLDFIERDIACVDSINELGAGLTHTVVAMHSRPYDEQFNNNVAKPFDYYISSYPGMLPLDGSSQRSFCINGHNHAHEIYDLFGNGILYYQVPNVAKRTYFIFTITDEGYEYEAVEF